MPGASGSTPRSDAQSGRSGGPRPVPFLAVALFASLLGVATIVHWGVFNHRHPAFWVWAALYFAAPFLVVAAWLANRRHGEPARTGERHLSIAVRAVVAAIGALALTQG